MNNKMADGTTIVKVLVLVILLIVLLSFIQFFTSIHPPRYRDPAVPSDYGLQYENVSFKTRDNITINAWLIPSKKANGTIIIGHGYPFNKGNILPVAIYLYPTYNLLFYDHRYFGESEGKITTVGIKETEDVKAAVKFVKEKYGQKHPISMYGFSLSASAMLLSKETVKAVIADSPYADLGRMVKHIYWIFGPLKYPFVVTTNLFARLFFGIYPKDVSPAQAIKNSTVPIFVIHGEKDSQIPVENAYVLKESNPGIELWIVPGADHGYAHALTKDEYERKIKEFLKKHMR
jgi:pimeloyl-ACP methyl ester carboxylesterase